MSFLINPLLSIVAGVATTYYLNNKSPPPPTSPSAASPDLQKDIYAPEKPVSNSRSSSSPQVPVLYLSLNEITEKRNNLKKTGSKYLIENENISQ
jgi:hypothetical protein